jgi:mono/diheme cytochrome c family protein
MEHFGSACACCEDYPTNLIPQAMPTHPAPLPSKLSAGDAKVVQMGKSVYEQRCAMCHSAKESGAPPKETLAQFPNDKIVNVLINGLMQDMALGLGDEEIQAVATYLTFPGAAP